VLYGLEAATSCVEDMDEWLGTFNVKLRHMREDIASVRASTSQSRLYFSLIQLNLVIIVVFVGITVISFGFYVRQEKEIYALV
jgi:hypothetical protein